MTKPLADVKPREPPAAKDEAAEIKRALANPIVSKKMDEPAESKNREKTLA